MKVITDVGDKKYYTMRAVELIYRNDLEQAIKLLALAQAEIDDGRTANKKERQSRSQDSTSD